MQFVGINVVGKEVLDHRFRDASVDLGAALAPAERHGPEVEAGRGEAHGCFGWRHLLENERPMSYDEVVDQAVVAVGEVLVLVAHSAKGGAKRA